METDGLDFRRFHIFFIATPYDLGMKRLLSRSVFVWSLRMRLFHWFLAPTILILWLSGDDQWLDIHTAAGYGVGLLLMARLHLGLTGTGHERFRAAYGPGVRMFKNPLAAARETSLDSSGHPPASAVTLGMLLIVLIGVVISGVAALGAMEMEGPLAGVLMDLDKRQARALKELHEIFANLSLLLIGAHIAGVLIDHFIHKTGVIQGMITGYKEQKDV